MWHHAVDRGVGGRDFTHHLPRAGLEEVVSETETEPTENTRLECQNGCVVALRKTLEQFIEKFEWPIITYTMEFVLKWDTNLRDSTGWSISDACMILLREEDTLTLLTEVIKTHNRVHTTDRIQCEHNEEAKGLVLEFQDRYEESS